MAYGLKHGDDETREETWARVLKAGYGEESQGPMPDRFRELLQQLDDAEERPMTPCDASPAWLTRPPRDR